MGSKQRKYNDSIVKRLNLQGARPLVKILDPSGREIGEHIGYIHLPAFMNILYSILKIPNPPVFPAKQQFSTKTIDGKQVSNEFQITHWGTARNAVNKPFSSGIVTAVAPGEKLYLRVKYRISKNFSPTVYPKMYFTDCAIKILPSPILKSKSGEFICVIISRKTDNCDELHFDLHDQTSSARAYLSIPVRLSFDRKLLSPEAVSRENALKKQAELKMLHL